MRERASTISGEPLDIAGIRFWTRKVGDIARVMRGAVTNLILLAHTPSRLPEAAALAVPLVLSGHTHGGQIVLPGLGAIAAREFPVVAGTRPARRDRDLRQPRASARSTCPVRLNCPPEVALLTLQPTLRNPTACSAPPP